MTDRNETYANLWSYVHGQLGGPERADFEKALRDDPDLKRAVDTARRFDHDLRRSLSREPLTDEALAARCERAWDADADAQRQAAAEEHVRPAPRRHHLLVWPWLRAPWVLAAAAAAVLVVAGVSFLPTGPVLWEGPTFEGLAYRSDVTPPPARYKAADAIACFRELRAATDRALREAQRTPSSPLHVGLFHRRLRIDFVMREVPGDAFAVELTARGAGGDVRQRWSETFTGLDDFHARFEAMARRVAHGLCAPAEAAYRDEGTGG